MYVCCCCAFWQWLWLIIIIIKSSTNVTIAAWNCLGLGLISHFLVECMNLCKWCFLIGLAFFTPCCLSIFWQAKNFSPISAVFMFAKTSAAQLLLEELATCMMKCLCDMNLNLATNWYKQARSCVQCQVIMLIIGYMYTHNRQKCEKQILDLVERVTTQEIE